MDIRLFRDLETLDKTGNFSEAAALSNLSQPAFSRRIKALETWVGASLVDRTRQPVRLTAAGIQMMEAGTAALAQIEQSRRDVQDQQSAPDTYLVTFGAQHSIGWRFYPAWLQKIEQDYGPILSRLRADDLPACMRDLDNGDVDFVIAYVGDDLLQGATRESVVIGRDQLIAVSKPDAYGRPIYNLTRAARNLPLLRFGDSAPLGAHIGAMFARHALGKQFRVIYENSMTGALRVRARTGDGIAWLPQSLVQPDLDSGVLVRTGDEAWSVDLTIRLFRNTERKNRVTEALWTFLTDAPDAAG